VQNNYIISLFEFCEPPNESNEINISFRHSWCCKFWLQYQ